ncbi:MAG TPA: hypothetical protein VGP94_03795 [Tepidisphaeraceae bacterium]|jgi:hypothetical protein|nr:hypothetical protein [Tepidisphaeraceae bacterium]
MALQCSGIACINEDICEVDHGGIRVKVRIDDVRSLTLGYGFQTLHPKLQYAFGIALLAPGAWAIFHLLHWAIFGAPLIIYQAALLLCGFFGIGLIVTARRRGLYLDIDTAKGTHRFAFHQTPSLHELHEFLDSLDQHLTVPISSSAPGISYANARAGTYKTRIAA